MNERWQQIKDYVNALTLRERVIVLLVVLVVDFVLVDTLWLGGALSERERIGKQLHAKQSTNMQTKQQLEGIQSQVQERAQQVAAQRDALQRQIDSLDSDLSDAANGFIPAEKMPGVLEDVLRQQQGLALVSLANLPAVQLDTNESSTAKGKSNSESLYKHGVELKVSGGYHDLLQYLAKLESMPWYFHWQELDYQIDSYPEGVLSLKVYTYSTDKEWIGV